MRCIGTDAGVPCERDADAKYPDLGLCQRHYMRHWRSEKAERPACPDPNCKGRMDPTSKPVSVGTGVLRKRRCMECRREYVTLESVIPRRAMKGLSETLLNAFSERMLSTTDTPAAVVDGVDAASTSPTT